MTMCLNTLPMDNTDMNLGHSSLSRNRKWFQMKLLFDQNLSPRLPNQLEDIFPGSVHVRIKATPLSGNMPSSIKDEPQDLDSVGKLLSQ